MNINDNDIKKYIDADLEKAIIVFDKYLENQFNVKNRNKCIINAVKIIPELIQRIVILEKEADWLALKQTNCPSEFRIKGCQSDNINDVICTQCWRESARRLCHD